jgi:hypothetical protein
MLAIRYRAKEMMGIDRLILHPVNSLPKKISAIRKNTESKYPYFDGLRVFTHRF